MTIKQLRETIRQELKKNLKEYVNFSVNGPRQENLKNKEKELYKAGDQAGINALEKDKDEAKISDTIEHFASLGFKVDENRYKEKGEVIIKLGINSYIKITPNAMGGPGNWIDLHGFLKGYSNDKILEICEALSKFKFN